MAEAFAILSSDIGVLDIAGRTSARLIKTVQTWKNCPSVILALSNEVSDVRVILDHLAKVCQDPDASSTLHTRDLPSAIQTHVQKTACYLRELDVIVKELEILPGTKQKLKLVFKKMQVGKLETSLRDVRMKLNHLLLIHNV